MFFECLLSVLSLNRDDRGQMKTLICLLDVCHLCSDIMPVYEYKGVTTAGKKVSGVQDGEGLKTVRAKLKKDGIVVLEIREGEGLRARGSREVRLFSGRVRLGDLANATRQLATLLSSGLPLMDALTVLVEQEETQTLKSALSS